MIQTQIRICSIADAAKLALIGQASFLETFAGILNGNDILNHCVQSHAPSVYQKWLESSLSKTWLAETSLGNASIGYLVLTPADLPIENSQPDDLEIKRIYLLTRFQGGGLGKGLMLEAISYAKQIGCKRLLLGVYQNNAQAIGFYQRFGFTQIGVRKFRVGDSDYDDVILGLLLSAHT